MTADEARADATSESESGAENESESTGTASPSRVRTALNYAILAGLVLLALVAVVQFYLSTSRAITIWVTPEYRPLFHAAFNLVVVFVTGVGILRQLRRMEFGGSAESDEEEPREEDRGTADGGADDGV